MARGRRACGGQAGGGRHVRAESFIEHHLFGVMGPPFNESVAVENFFEPIGRRRVQAKKLGVMARICFVDGHHVGGVVVEGSEPFLFLLG